MRILQAREPAEGRLMGDFSRHLDRYLPGSGDLGSKDDANPPVPPQGKGRDMAVLDLHGATREQARTRLDHALKDALSRGVSQLLVIHGKGLNSPKEAILPGVVRDLLEGHALAGEVRVAPKELGGSGAVIVRVRIKSRK